jgi:hypothetical protein
MHPHPEAQPPNQMLEAGVRHVAVWCDTDEARHILMRLFAISRLIHRPNARRCNG